MKRGTKHTEQTRQLLSARMTEVYADPDLRRRVARRTAETWRDGTRGRAPIERLEAAWLACSRKEQLRFIARRIDVSAAPRAPGRRRSDE